MKENRQNKQKKKKNLKKKEQRKEVKQNSFVLICLISGCVQNRSQGNQIKVTNFEANFKVYKQSPICILYHRLQPLDHSLARATLTYTMPDLVSSSGHPRKITPFCEFNNTSEEVSHMLGGKPEACHHHWLTVSV